MISDKNWEALVNAGVEFVVKTPQLLFLILSARVSGEGWIYIYLTYYKTTDTNDDLVKGQIGKLIAGLIWMSITFVPLYYVINGFHQFQQSLALEMIISVVVYALFIQLLVFIATIAWREPR